MFDNAISAMVTVASLIIGVAILSVLLSPQAQTSNVLKALSGGLAQDLQAATAPISGNGLSFNTGFGGLGTSSI